MGEIFKKPIFIIIVVVAIIGALVWSYVAKTIQSNKQKQAEKAAEEVVITDLTNVDPALYDEPIKNEYAAAAAKSLEANPKLLLAAISVEIPPVLGLKSANTRYIFVSDKDAINNWTITFASDTGNFIRAIIPKDDYMGNPTVMDTKLWKFNYVTALQIAEKDGGLAWRESNELKGITLTLKHGDPNNWLVWTVNYQGANSSFTRKIDANSGKIVESNT